MQYVTRTVVRPRIDHVGAHRYRFHKRPNLPYLVPISREELLRPSADGLTPLEPPQGDVETEVAVRARDCHVQTEFREIEVQTDPFNPDYVVQEGENPEILELSHFAWGQDLPITMAGIEQILKMRERKAVEAALPAVVDEETFQQRVKVLAEQDMRQWQDREAEIARIQQQQLDRMISEMESEAAVRAEHQQHHLAKIRAQKEAERNLVVERLHRQRVKTLRRIAMKRTRTTGPRDIVADYARHGSAVYAPMRREGRTIHRGGTEIQSGIIKNVLRSGTKIERLQDKFVDLYVQPKRPEFKAPRSKRSYLSALNFQSQLVDKLHNTEAEQLVLQPTKEVVSAEHRAKQLHVPEAALAMLERPKTPRVAPLEGIDGEEASFEFNDILTRLQAVIRGRKTQEIILRGFQTRRALVKELRMTERAQQLDQHIPQRPVSASDTSVDALAGSLIAPRLQFLEKELGRFREQRELDALADLALARRADLEAAETARRVDKVLDYREKKAIHERVCKVHERAARLRAVRLLTSATSVHAREELPDLPESTKPGVVLKNLLKLRLLPEVSRDALKRQVRTEQAAIASAVSSQLKEELM